MGNLEGGSSTDRADSIEKNRRIFATYPRAKLIQFCRDFSGDASFGANGYGQPERKLEDLTDDELRDFALSLTQGI